MDPSRNQPQFHPSRLATCGTVPKSDQLLPLSFVEADQAFVSSEREGTFDEFAI
jgi:hypothetical protein